MKTRREIYDELVEVGVKCWTITFLLNPECIKRNPNLTIIDNARRLANIDAVKYTEINYRSQLKSQAVSNEPK